MKKAMTGMESIITMVLLVIVMLFILSPTALWGRDVNRIRSTLPGMVDVNINDPPTSSEETVEYLKEGMNALVEAFRFAQQSPVEKGCIVVPGTALPNKFDGHVIEVKTVSDKTDFTIVNKNGQTVSRALTVDGVKPCVVYGTLSTGGSAPENFYDNWLDGTPCDAPDRCKMDFNENDVFLTDDKKIEFHGTEYDRENIFYLYKADKNHVCFFVTYDGGSRCNAKPKGLDDNCAYDVGSKLDICKAPTIPPEPTSST